MMSEIPLEGSSSNFNEAVPVTVPEEVSPSNENRPEDLPVQSSQGVPSTIPYPTGPSLTRRISSALFCPCGCEPNNQSTPLHHIQPVIVRPTNDVYLELKKNRRIRVIHIPPGFNFDVPTTQTDGLNGNPGLANLNRTDDSSNEDSSSEEDEEYWFQNADPNRPQIKPQHNRAGQAANQRRIFHKLAPQDRSKVSNGTEAKVEKNIISPGRLPRKKFAGSKEASNTAESKAVPKRNVTKSKETSPRPRSPSPTAVILSASADGQGFDDVIDGRKSPAGSIKKTPTGSIRKELDAVVALTGIPDLILNLGDLKHHDDSDSSLESGRKSPKTFDAESPDPTHVSVVSIPDPGESSTDNDLVGIGSADNIIVTGSVIVTGSYLGGVANIGFEDEEDETDSRTASATTSSAAATSSSPTPAAASTSADPLNDSLDTGYQRHRNLSDINISWKSGDDDRVESDPASEDDSAPASLDVTAEEVKKPMQTEVIDTLAQPINRKPILFFIHGVGGSADSWQNQLLYFSSLGYEVVAPDLLGHGFSSTPDREKSYVFEKLFRDIVTVFDHFCVAGGRLNFSVVVGHSYGASLATALARARPEFVKILVLISSGGPTALVPPLSAPQSRFITCLTPVLNKFGFVQRKRAKTKGKTSGVHDGFHVPAYVIRHTLMGQVWPDGDIAFHRRITIPTLLVYGLKDGFVSLVEMCEMERTLPKAYLELIPLAGHHVMQDQPKELNVMIKKFVEKYQPKAAAARAAQLQQQQQQQQLLENQHQRI